MIDEFLSSTPLSDSSPSSVVSGRLPSSFVSVTCSSRNALVSLSCSYFHVGSGTISASNLPASCAAAVRCCDCSEYSSCASRETLYFFATKSAVCSIGM